ncbi:MAG: tetratricopeptide repeat protein, partial [Planctomycetota bacterium]
IAPVASADRVARAHLDQGRELASQKPPRLRDALDQLDEAVRLGPHLQEAWALRGWVHERRKEYAETIRDCTRAIELDAKDGGSFANRGSAHFRLRAYDDAIRDCTRAIELDARNVSGWCMRALAREQKKDYAGAASDMERVIELSPDRPEFVKMRDRMRGKAN